MCRPLSKANVLIAWAGQTLHTPTGEQDMLAGNGLFRDKDNDLFAMCLGREQCSIYRKYF
jgi:hypothetical protein